MNSCLYTQFVSSASVSYRRFNKAFSCDAPYQCTSCRKCVRGHLIFWRPRLSRRRDGRIASSMTVACQSAGVIIPPLPYFTMRTNLLPAASAACLLGVAFAYQSSPMAVPPVRRTSLHMSASVPVGGPIPQTQLSKTAAARRALFGGARYHPTSSTSLNAAASAAAIYHSPDESNDAEKPFNPGPYFEFGNSGLKLNWFGAIYGTVAISLGIIWYASLCACQLMYWITRGKVDKHRRVPVTFSQIWGITLMNLMGCTPKVTGLDNIKKVFKENG